jgi:3'(2'), 5'-bisphosphate nucleotidase
LRTGTLATAWAQGYLALVAQDPSALLETAARLALGAGQAIMAARARGCEVNTKADATPVTEADHAAEALITAGLAPLGLPVVAEEAEAAGAGSRACAEYWLVDPLDGTREFAAGRDSFAVNIGLVRGGRPVLGAVMLPAHGELFLGLPGIGAWKQVGAARVPIHARRPPPQGPTIYASAHRREDARLLAWLAEKRPVRVIHIGSAEKFCRLAEGAGDLYPRFGTTMEWDTAAPQAVLEAAGGACLTCEGAPLGYGKPGWRNPDFFARGAA